MRASSRKFGTIRIRDKRPVSANADVSSGVQMSTIWPESSTTVMPILSGH